MFQIEMQEPSSDFAQCWSAAGRHLNQQVQDPVIAWLKAELKPPFLEHLSFRLGNQLFFIRIEDVADELKIPGNKQGLRNVANACDGHACLMPMRRSGDGWSTVSPGWGLVGLETGEAVDPSHMVSDEPVEMTNWELHHFAVQVVRDQLLQEQKTILSWNGDPNVDPSLWFMGATGPEWVVVRDCRYPENTAARPDGWGAIAKQCSQLSTNGHFASVAFVSSDQLFDEGAPVCPLLRGHGTFVAYNGLEA